MSSTTAVLAAAAAVLAAAVVGLGAAPAHGAGSGGVFPVSWSEVEPEAEQTATDPSADRAAFGACVCDVTFERCDFNCECDAECTSADRTVFTGADHEGPRPLSVRKCVDAELVEANERGGLTTTLVDNLLCIERVNNDERDYFKDPGELTQGEVSETLLAREHSYRPALAAQGDARDHYLLDDPVGGAAESGGAILPAFGGLMPLPVAGFGGECTDRAAPLFLRDAGAGPARRCTRFVASLPTDCASDLGHAAYSTDLRVKAAPNSALDDASGWVTPTLVSAVRRDAATGAEVAVADPSTVAQAYAGGVCSDALVELHYDITYEVRDASDGGAVITAVGVSIVVTDVTAAAAARVQQQFTASFATASPAALERAKSGAPGYTPGEPVLAGTRATDGDKAAIEQCVDGLQVLPQLLAGRCDTGGTLWHTVRFGRDASLSCTLTMTLSELAAECADPATVRSLLAPNVTHVAQYGGADFANTKDWAEVDGLNSSTVSSSYDSVARHCTVTNVLNLEFVTADVGAFENPQRKVVAARASLSTDGGWSFPDSNGASEHDFPVTVTATFVHLEDQALEPYVPSAPPVLPRLPRDVLYPLYVEE